MLTVGLVMVAVMIALFATSVMAAPDNQNAVGNGKVVAYDAQNGCGQGNCDGTCDGTCDGNCDQNQGKKSGQRNGTGFNGRQGSAARGNNQGCNGSCQGN